MTRAFLAWGVLAVSASMSLARSEDGTLSTIRVPNNGQPAIVVRGESFTVRATAEADLFLGEGGTLNDLSEEWMPVQSGIYEAVVNVPLDFAPGLYSVVADAGGVEDVQKRAVLVLDAAPKQYTLAHIASPAIHNAIEASLAGAFPNDSPLAVIVTGNLTANGTADDFRTLIDWLNTASVPTFIAPGPRDFADGRFAKYFDPGPHMTRCGLDAIVTVGETVPGLDDLDPGDAGRYQRLRRTMKPARWSMAISGYSHAMLNPRVQIVLFVDTPLHAFIAGSAEATDTGIQQVEWDSFQGPTQIIAPVKGAPPGVQWIGVSPAGIGPTELARDNEP